MLKGGLDSIAVTEEGVFARSFARGWLYGGATLFLVGLALLWGVERASPYSSFGHLLSMLGFAMWFQARQRRRGAKDFSGRGIPLVAAFDGDLWTSGSSQTPLETIERVVLFGPRIERKLCVVDRCGQQEITPVGWNAMSGRETSACEQWLQTTLSKRLTVVVEPHQSVLASLRRDGPATESLRTTSH